MIVGLGLDVCDVARMRRNLDRFGPRFMDRLLTPAESAYCKRRIDPAVPFAARFAVKEAVIKAFGGAPSGMRWQDMEVLPAEGGPPRLVLRNAGADAAARLGITRTHITITHDAGVAAAVVILERDGAASP